MEDKTIYLSGPISNKGKCTEEQMEKNVQIAEEIYAKLVEKGYAPFCPHLSYYPDKRWREQNIRTISHSTWMEIDRQWVHKCKYFFYMKPEIYGESCGAKLEFEQAKKEGKRIFTDLKEVPSKIEIQV